MKETDIRPDSLHQGQIKAFQHDIDRLLKHKKEFVKVNCPACDTYDKWASTFAYRKDFKFVTCEKCDTIYINPRPTPQLLEDYYKNSEHYKYWSKFIFPQTEEARREQIFKPRADKVVEIAKINKIKWTLMDVGAGFGTFCEEIKTLNWFSSIVAVEPTPELAQICKNKGVETLAYPIENITVARANVLTAFELIEHLFSPKDFIRKCHEILTPKGLLILTCPNAKGFDMSVLGEKSESFNPEHLNYFNPKSLSLLVGNNGFEVLEISTPGKLDVELVKKQASPNDLAPFMWELVNLGDKFQQFLVENKLSSHMWLVARKK